MLYATRALGTEITWIGEPPAAEGETVACTAKFRYRQSDQPVEISWQGDEMKIHALERQRAITPGQSCVLLSAREVLWAAALRRV